MNEDDTSVYTGEQKLRAKAVAKGTTSQGSRQVALPPSASVFLPLEWV